jgi:hypothetical protein
VVLIQHHFPVDRTVPDQSGQYERPGRDTPNQLFRWLVQQVVFARIDPRIDRPQYARTLSRQYLFVFWGPRTVPRHITHAQSHVRLCLFNGRTGSRAVCRLGRGVAGRSGTIDPLGQEFDAAARTVPYDQETIVVHLQQEKVKRAHFSLSLSCRSALL